MKAPRLVIIEEAQRALDSEPGLDVVVVERAWAARERSPLEVIDDRAAADRALAPGERLVVQQDELRRRHLPVAASRLAQLCDGRLALDEIFARAGVPPLKGIAVVLKLCALGVLRPAPMRPATDPFTPLEEAFFSAELAPIDECDEPFERWSERLRRRLRALRRG